MRAPRISRRSALVLSGTAVALALSGGVAWAFWTAQASNVPAYGRADSMTAGSTPSGTVTGTSVNLAWSAGTTAGGHPAGGYRISRYPSASGGTATAAAQGTCAAVPANALSCTESNVPAGTWYYTVTPVLGAWQGGESPRSAGMTTGDSFSLSVPALTAGNAATVTLTAVAAGHTDTGFTGDHPVSFSGPGNAPDSTAPSYNNGTSIVTFVNGVATVPITLYKAENTTLTATSGNVAGNQAVAVSPGAAAQFQVPAPSGAVAGTAQNVTLAALDAYRNTATGYTGGKTLTWSGPGTAVSGQAPAYPANPVTFTSGTATMPLTLYLAQTTSLSVGDSHISGASPSFTVSPGAAAQFAVSTGLAQRAGTAFPVTVTALDAYKNTATGYTGSKTLAVTGPSPAPDGTPAPSSVATVFSAGTATATLTLVKAESATLTLKDGSLTGTSAQLTVSAGDPARLAWSGVTVSAGTLSSPCSFTCTDTGIGNSGTLTAKIAITDAYGNIVSNLGRTITVTANGGGFTSPSTGTSVNLTTSATGLAESTQTFTFKSQNGSWTSDTLTATSGTYSNATATVTKS